MDADRFQLLDQLFSYHREVMGRHRRWLSSFPRVHSDRWEQRLITDPEAALVEAGVWDIVRQDVDLIEPFEDVSHGGPDFRCTRGESRFYVETTSLEIDSVTRETAMPHMPPTANESKAQFYGLLTRRFRSTAAGKAAQCATVKDAPCLLAIGTMHFQASCVCFREVAAEFVLTSETKITSRFDEAKGEAVGGIFLSTDLRRSAFIKRAESPARLIDPARQTISGILLCGVGRRPPNVYGVLHAEALRPFDRKLLPSIEFCRLCPGYEQGQIAVEWI